MSVDAGPKPVQQGRIVVISDSFRSLPSAVAVLERSGHSVTYVPELTPWAELSAQHRRALGEAHAVVMGRVLGTDEAALDLAPQLRVVALHTSGCDNVDIEAASRRRVLVTNVKGVNAEQCAEFAMGLMLCVVRKIVTGDQAIRAGLWASLTQSSMDLHGATMGVIGLGQIARAFVTRARAFGMSILVHTRTPDAGFAGRHDIEYVSLDALLARSDVVGVFASLDSVSRRMIGARELGLMKPSAYFINIARGELVDEMALLEALRNGAIAGAGLDVFENEPVTHSPFFELPNVVLTPHQAGLTEGGKTGAATRAARNALQALQGEVPADAVNPRAWREPYSSSRKPEEQCR
jgi:phosphoglycerate dehydrogenase-like enzyme